MLTRPLIAFCDTETTGLDAFRHQVYEVGLITPRLEEVYAEDEEGGADEDEPIGYELEWDEHTWWLSVDLGNADPVALRVGDYHGRHPRGHGSYHRGLSYDRDKEVTDPEVFASAFARLTNGLSLAGMVPSFDELFLRGLLMANGQCPMYHYQPIDVETLAAGYLHLQQNGDNHDYPELALPWDSEALSLAVGVDPAKFERHTALGDARWAKAVWEAVTGQ